MLKIVNLRVENQLEPMALGVEKPVFSWSMVSDRRAARQLAYRVTVAHGGELIFDSEQVNEDTCLGIEYAGEPLLPLSEYTVRAEIWDNDGQYARAETRFATARFDLPWQAHWVEPEQEPTPRETPSPNFADWTAVQDGPSDTSDFRPAQYLRQTFAVKTGLKRALAFATAHGVYRLYINGERPDAREFAPEATSYETFLQYQTYDVTDLVTPGENAVGAILADGWWTGRVGMLGLAGQYGDKTALLMELRLEYEDGAVETVVSDDFKSAAGAIDYSDIFVGERCDARREPRGWSRAGYNDDAWSPVRVLELGYENLRAQYGAPVLPAQELPAKSILTTPRGDTIVDFGQTLAGRVRLTVDAPEGAEIRLEHFEVLGPDGELFPSQAGRNKDQTDVYVTRAGRQTWEPMFTYHGFRYVRVTGWPGAISADMFTAVALTSAMEDTGRFACSDERLNRLQENIRWSQISNTLALPTDCPQRERAGWTGDISIFAPTMAFNRDCLPFLTRWLADCRAAQLPGGEIPVVVPYWPGYRMMGQAMQSATSSGWGDAIITVPWALYNAYGDLRALRDNYEAMRKWMDYVERRAEAGLPEGHEQFDEARLARQKYLWNTDFHYGDWLIPSLCKGGNAMEGMLRTGPVVASAYYAYDTGLMTQIALALEDLDGYRKYATLNQRVTEAFIAEYVGPDGRLAADFQGVYVLCLAFDLVPDELRGQMTAHLTDMIAENGGCLDTGFLSVPFLMDVLVREHRRDEAFKLLFQTRCPSWLYEVEHGATTIWESWDAIGEDGRPNVTSFNHYAFGCVGDWIYREVAGLNAAMPGYKRVRFTPGVDSGLDWAEASHTTPYGEASIRWEKRGDGYWMKVSVPANTEADIFFPSDNYTRDGRRVSAENGVLAIGMRAISVGSGEYEFEFR